ncbi:hypothetical protein HRbin06_00629 [archaeon HR06]|nr:hypothetical protein HRbin06_00629 [archaeon HR06]
MMKNKKAVSPIVATLLLIAISVAASVITYTFVSSSLSGQARQAQTSISIEDVQFKKASLTTAGSPTWTGVITETIFISGTSSSPTILTLTRTTDLATSPSSRLLNSYILVTVRNKGTVPAVIQTIYITLPDGTVKRTDFATGNVIPPGLTYSFVIPRANELDFFWQSATNYSIKVVTDTGFTAEGTFASPIG